MDAVFDLNTLGRWLHDSFKKGQVVSNSAEYVAGDFWLCLVELASNIDGYVKHHGAVYLPQSMDEKVNDIRRDVLIIDGEYRYETFVVAEDYTKLSAMDMGISSGKSDMVTNEGSTDGRSDKTCTMKAERQEALEIRICEEVLSKHMATAYTETKTNWSVATISSEVDMNHTRSMHLRNSE
ncbi:hypothetical protein EAF04_004533 [Stromatinia cepivora]|nr:hypothetical protein EAF04_004533 [Stromatinia cepivora]